MNKHLKGINNGILNNVVVNYISNDKILGFRGLKKAPNSTRVGCNRH